MCLLRDDSVKITGDRVWKLLTIKKGKISSTIHNFTWQPGLNTAHGRYFKTRDGLVREGFHVYLNKSDAEWQKCFASTPVFLVSFSFNLNDLIATGYGDSVKQAVFKRLLLSKEEYNRVLIYR